MMDKEERMSRWMYSRKRQMSVEIARDECGDSERRSFIRQTSWRRIKEVPTDRMMDHLLISDSS
jgi:hypothetical protein